MDKLITELLGYQNAIIMAVTWMLIEVTAPITRAVVMHPRLVKFRLRLYSMQQLGKRLAGVMWCSILVWIPYAQPPLCVDDVANGCQNIFNRVALGIILGGLLSSGHWAGAKAFRKLTGRKRKVWIVCANCEKKAAVESLDDACPHCGAPPHEVTMNKTRS